MVQVVTENSKMLGLLFTVLLVSIFKKKNIDKANSRQCSYMTKSSIKKKIPAIEKILKLAEPLWVLRAQTHVHQTAAWLAGNGSYLATCSSTMNQFLWRWVKRGWRKLVSSVLQTATWIYLWMPGADSYEIPWLEAPLPHPFCCISASGYSNKPRFLLVVSYSWQLIR